MKTDTTPSTEVKAILKAFCTKQREKYGDDWKKTLSKEMAENIVHPVRNKPCHRKNS